MPRPTKAALTAAYGKTIPDVIAPDLEVLFVGINPGLYSGATGFHFARPGNRFWPALHGGGFTPRLLSPDEGEVLLRCGLGITNLVSRTTATAAELERGELIAGARTVERKVVKLKPRRVAFLGLGMFRTAFGRPRATVGPQDVRVGAASAWLLPNPSGLNAHHQLPDLVREFARFREACGGGRSPQAPRH